MAGTQNWQQQNGGGGGGSGGYRRMGGQQLVQQAHQTWDTIHGSLQGQSKRDLEQVVDELTQRIEFAATGQEPLIATQYSTLDATALAHQTRSLISRTTQQVPSGQRDQLDIFTALAERVEGVSVGLPNQSRRQRQEQYDQMYQEQRQPQMA